jgi:flavin reductase (DIM6/NTAB) family NADH-FMN oxidoreductase RutF
MGTGNAMVISQCMAVSTNPPTVCFWVDRIPQTHSAPNPNTAKEVIWPARSRVGSDFLWRAPG